MNVTKKAVKELADAIRKQSKKKTIIRIFEDYKAGIGIARIKAFQAAMRPARNRD